MKKKFLIYGLIAVILFTSLPLPVRAAEMPETGGIGEDMILDENNHGIGDEADLYDNIADDSDDGNDSDWEESFDYSAGDSGEDSDQIADNPEDEDDSDSEGVSDDIADNPEDEDDSDSEEVSDDIADRSDDIDNSDSQEISDDIADDPDITTSSPGTIALTENVAATISLLNDTDSQWLSFTANKKGEYRFNAICSDSSPVKTAPMLYLYDNPDTSGECLTFFVSKYISGRCYYKLKKGQTVYLLMKTASDSGAVFHVTAEKVKEEVMELTASSGNTYTFSSENYEVEMTINPRNFRTDYTIKLVRSPNSFEYINVRMFSNQQMDTPLYNDQSLHKDSAKEFVINKTGSNCTFHMEFELAKDDGSECHAIFQDPSLTFQTLDGKQHAYLYDFIPDYTGITMKAEADYSNAKLRYRKKDAPENEWMECEGYVGYNKTDPVTITEGIEPATTYILQVGPSGLNSIDFTCEVDSKAFPGTVKKTLNGNKLTVTLTKYTGDYTSFFATVSWTDALGIKHEETKSADIKSKKATLEFELTDIAPNAKTKYRIIAGEQDENGRYQGYEKSFTANYTADILIPSSDYFTVKAAADSSDGSRAKVTVSLKDTDKIANLQDSYTANVYYKLKSEPVYSGDCAASMLISADTYKGTLTLKNLLPGEDYEITVLIDGSMKTGEFRTSDADLRAIRSVLKISPMMQGISLDVSLESEEEIKGNYVVNAYVWDEDKMEWVEMQYEDPYFPLILRYSNQYSSKDCRFGKVNSVRLNSENQFRVVIRKDGGGQEILSVNAVKLMALEYKVDISFEDIQKNSLKFMVKPVSSLDATTPSDPRGKLLYRESGTSGEWLEREDISYKTFYHYYLLQNLKNDTEYDVKFVLMGNEKSVLYEKERAFRTLPELARLSLINLGTGYDKARLALSHNSGITDLKEKTSRFVVYVKKESEEVYREATSFYTDEPNYSFELTKLEPGTTYDVLVERKGNDNRVISQGEDVIVSCGIKVKTEAYDYEITMLDRPEGIHAVNADLNFRLARNEGKLPSRMTARISLQEGTSAEKIGKTIAFEEGKDWETSVRFEGLKADTEYKVSAVLYENGTEVGKYDSFASFKTGKYPGADSLEILGGDRTVNKREMLCLETKHTPAETEVDLEWVKIPADSNVLVEKNGEFYANEAGEIEIRAVSRNEEGKITATSNTIKVTVVDYSLQLKKNGNHIRYFNQSISSGTKMQFVVVDNLSDKELENVTFSLDNPQCGSVTQDGLFLAERSGELVLTAVTAEGARLSISLTVLNRLESITLVPVLKNYDSDYAPIKDSKTGDWIIVPGEDYVFQAYANPLGAVEESLSAAAYKLTDEEGNVLVIDKEDPFNVPEKDVPKEGKTITLKCTPVSGGAESEVTFRVLRKPETLAGKETYLWINKQALLKDAGLPEGFIWKEADTVVDSIIGQDSFSYSAVLDGGYFYPMEQKMEVRFLTFREPVWNFQEKGDTLKGHYVPKDATAHLEIKELESGGPECLSEAVGLAVTGKNAKYVTMEGSPEKGYQITPSKYGSYNLAFTYNLYKAAWENGKIVRGELLGTYVSNQTLVCSDAILLNSISFEYDYDAENLKENGITQDKNVYTYEITSPQKAKENKARTFRVKMNLTDIKGEDARDADVKISSSDSSVATAVRDKEDPAILIITMKKKEGNATIKVEDAEGGGITGSLVVRVENYAPKVIKTYKAVIDTGCSENNKVMLASVYIPYKFDNGCTFYLIKDPSLKWYNSNNEVKGLTVEARQNAEAAKDGNYIVYVQRKEFEEVEATGKNLKYYLLVKYTKYDEDLYTPVYISVLDNTLTVTVKQDKADNLFYADTLNERILGETGNGKVLSTVQITARNTYSDVEVRRVIWRPGLSAAEAPDQPSEVKNTEFLISRNGYAGSGQYRYIIDNNHPVLDSKHRASKEAVKGTLYIYLRGYDEPVKRDFTIKTTYKKPSVKIKGSASISAGKGNRTGVLSAYGNAYDNYKTLLMRDQAQAGYIGKYYKDIYCTDPEVQVLVNSKFGGSGNFVMEYNGKKSKQVTLVFRSDSWQEPVSARVKLNVKKTRAKLSAQAMTMNVAYPTNCNWVEYYVFLQDISNGNYCDFDRVVVSADGSAKELLDKGYVSIKNSFYYSREYGENQDRSGDLIVALNCPAFQVGKAKCGTYKYKITPYKGDYCYGTYTYTLKITNQKAAVRLRISGKVDLMKVDVITSTIIDYRTRKNNVKAVPKFTGINPSYKVEKVSLKGEYAQYFWAERDSSSNGIVYIHPNEAEHVKAGRNYKLEVVYTLSKEGDNFAREITVSDYVTVKVVSNKPKVKAENVVLHSATCYDKEVWFEMGDMYRIKDMKGNLDVNQDGITDLSISMDSRKTSEKKNNKIRYRAYVNINGKQMNALKPGSYKIPVQITFTGEDGVNGTYTYYVNVKVKK